MPKVSIIIPAYNVGHTLSTCLETVISQTFKDIEIIVVDDGSKDDTKKIIKEYAALDSRIVPIHQENRGVSSARNVALSVASGEYIIFIDSDDSVTNEYVDELMRWSDYDFVTAGYKYQTADGSWFLREFEDITATKDDVQQNPSRFLGKYYFGSPWATLMKKKIIDEHTLKFDESIHCGEDTLFITQYLMHVSTIRVVPFCGYNYFYYPGSLGNSVHKEMWKWKIQVEHELINFFAPLKVTEVNTLLFRKFDILKNLLRDYSQQMSNKELVTIYEHPFFENAIRYKRENGAFMDRMLIFAMERQNYQMYVRADRIRMLLCRVKNKIKRTFKG